MRVDVVVPQLGEAVSEVTLAAWYKRPGEAVKKGEPLFQVDMDKSVIDVEAFDDGVLVEVLVAAGTAVTPQTVVARLEVAGRAAGEVGAGPAERAPTADATSAPGAPPRPAEAARPTARSGGSRVSPRARRLAESHGVDLAGLLGTGPDGLVTEQDVQRALAGRSRP